MFPKAAVVEKFLVVTNFCDVINFCRNANRRDLLGYFKVARLDFLGLIPPQFEH